VASGWLVATIPPAATVGDRTNVSRYGIRRASHTIGGVLTLYDADRCPYAARARIALAEKRLSYETVAIDLDDRPAWLYTKNSAGRVPVLEEDGGLVLPESLCILEYLEERFPEPALLPPDPAERALARLRIERFDDLGSPYYAVRRGVEGSEERLHAALAALDSLLEAQPYLTGRDYGLADIAYIPWILRGQALFGLELDPFPAVEAWAEQLEQRPAVAAETAVVAAL
jgi:glutathione S-transferase